MKKGIFQSSLNQASIVIIAATLAACSTMANSKKSDQLVSTASGNRQVAQVTKKNKPTVINVSSIGGEDYRSTYPTLSRLCASALKVGSSGGLDLGTALFSPEEYATIGLKCHAGMYQGKAYINFEPTAYKTIISGVSSWHQDMMGWFTLVLGTAKDKTTADLIFESGDVGMMVEHLILNLNDKGQPMNTPDHFSGTVDPQSMVAAGEDASQYTSGFYVHQSVNDTLTNCILLSGSVDGVDAPSCIANSTSATAETKTAMVVGGAFMGTLASGLGWKVNMSPTNKDLDKDAGRVDFQKALKELQAFLKTRNNDPTYDIAGTIKEAQQAIQQQAASND